MAYIDNKYHIKINGQGYVLSQGRGGQFYYQKKKAPSFVNKFGGGDSSYRDSTFWQFWASTNWRNGCKQLRLDDPGKFWKSQDVNTTQLDEITLSRSFVSVGQTAAGTKVNAISPWRTSQNWWNVNYGYRKQLTVTAPASYQIPAGYPVKITENTASLVTASKLRSDRNDWRVVYFNGTTWEDLKRDYIEGAITFFGLKNAIPAGTSDTSYYIYYGYATESTSSQPSTEADWNSVYGMYGTSPDSNSMLIAHMREGSGTGINDDSPKVNPGVTFNNMTWGNDGLLGRYLVFNGSNQYTSFGNGVDFNLGSFTLEGWIYVTTAGSTRNIISKWYNTSSSNGGSYQFQFSDGGLRLFVLYAAGLEIDTRTTVSCVPFNQWVHVAVTYDGSANARFFVNGQEYPSRNPLNVGVMAGPGINLNFGRNEAEPNSSSWYFGGLMQHMRVSNVARSSFPYAIPANSQPTVSAGTEITTQPPSSSADLYAGCSNGKVYKYDGAAFSEQFDTRRVVWYETGTIAAQYLGDFGGTEYWEAQSFTVPSNVHIKGAEIYMKKNAGTPTDITVRIETNNAGSPSGTLANNSLTGTITAFTDTNYAWRSVEFADSVQLSSGTTYWLVIKTAAAANDNNYFVGSNNSSPTYAGGNQAYSTNSGSSWTAVAGVDLWFRIKGNTTSVNDMLVTSVGANRKLLVASGSPSSQTNTDARIYSYDGSLWTLEKVFGTSTESQVTKLAEFNGKLYAGVGPQARVYEGSNQSTWTLSKDIDVPQNPGYIYALKEYNGRLYAGGGAPEFLYDKHYSGFWYVFDGTTWVSLYPFDFTEIRAFEFYDAFLFGTTYQGNIYIYDTATLNPLFNFKDGFNYQASIHTAQLYDDKIYFLLYPQDSSNETNVGIYVFDRHGISLAHTISGVTGYRCAAVINNSLYLGTGDNGYVYRLDLNTYTASGWLQTSYFDASLPSIDKLYSNVVVQHDPLPVGCSIKVYYKFKESDSWTLLGTSDTTDSESKTLSFPTGTTSKKISFKYELITTNSAATPKLKEYVLQYALMPVRKWMWNLRVLAKKNIMLADKSLETKTATELRTAIETAENSNQLIAFVDQDGTTYNVLFNDIDQSSWVLNQGDVSEDEVAISLIEA